MAQSDIVLNNSLFAVNSKSLQSKAKETEIKNFLKEILYTSLSQAIIKIFLTPHLILKVFLTIFVLVSSVLASYLVIQSIIVYFTYEVTTKSRIVYETPTLFPKVTFCNLNEFTTEYAFNLTQQGVYYGNNLLNEEKQKLGHDLNDILFDCKFNNIDCDATDFAWSYDNSYGNCYTLNSSLKKSYLAGPEFGLTLTLYVNVYEKLLNVTNQLYGLGAIFRIGNSSYLTHYSNGGIFVSPSMVTNIVVDREFKSVLTKPYSNCDIESNSAIFNGDLYKLIEHSDYVYTQQLCFTQCLQKYIINKYNCTLYMLVSLYSVDLCEWELYLKIVSTDDFFTDNFINEICLPQCPLECNQTLYKTSLSSYQLIGSSYREKIVSNQNLKSDFIYRDLDLTQVEKSFLSVSIYYESLSYTLTTESPQMDLVALLSSIGGNLGLFLEMSLFSLCELIEVVIELIFTLKIKSNKILLV
jgi:hypothetical protein